MEWSVARLFLALALACPAALPADDGEAGEWTPSIPLFESVETVREYLEGDCELDYSGLYLSGITLQHVEGHPRPGTAWHYSFLRRVPTLGGGVGIYHYMDGEIIELPHGP